EHRPTPAAVTPRELFPGDDRLVAAGQPPKRELECVGNGERRQAPAARQPPREVADEVLAYAEDDPDAPAARDPREHERERVRAEQPDRVELVELGRKGSG